MATLIRIKKFFLACIIRIEKTFLTGKQIAPHAGFHIDGSTFYPLCFFDYNVLSRPSMPAISFCADPARLDRSYFRTHNQRIY